MRNVGIFREIAQRGCHLAQSQWVAERAWFHASFRDEGTIMADMNNRYGPTAVREGGRPDRELSPKTLTVDMHSRVIIRPSSIPLAHFVTPETEALNRRRE
jgi:hypothetical protein